MSSFELLGSSLNSAPIDVLERMALSSQEVRKLYGRLKEIVGIEDALVLSTCNRTEIYFSGKKTEEALAPKVWTALKEMIGPERIPQEDNRYGYSGREGIAHLFRVSCGLDSVVLGEAQILGQVKGAYDDSRDHFRSTYFDKVIQSAFRVAGRSRTETEIGAGAVSIASAGVHLAGRVFSDFSNRTVVVVGAGDTGRLAAEHFARRNPKRLIILNRTLERAAKLATQLGADAWSISKISDALVNADVLVTAVKVANPVIDAALVESAMRARTSQTLVILDLGLPRNVSTRVNGIVNVFLSDIEDLRQVVDGNLKRRRKETPKVEAFIHQEIDRLMNWQRSFQAGPLIGALREGIEQIRLAELEKLGKNLSQVERAAVDKTTRAIMNKLLHGPMEAIHQYARQAEQGAEGLELIREMFGNLTESLKETASEEDESEGTS